MNDKKRRRVLYIADNLITPDRTIKNAAVLVEGKKILAVGGLSGFAMDDTFESKRFENAYITPGFIDTHIYGAGGCDCSSIATSPHTLEDMSRVLGTSGVTGFFPSVVSDTPENMLSNLAELARAIRRPMPGAEPLAISIVGPFINPERRGSQKLEVLKKIDLGLAKELIAAGDGLVKLMTFAPELENSEKLIELLVESGIHPAMGHSSADATQALRAIDAGANHCTHLFNCMLPLHQRDIGLAGIEVYDHLRDDYGIQIEFGDIGNLLAILSAGDRMMDVERLISALAEIKRLHERSAAGLFDHEYIDPCIAMTPQAAFYAKKRRVPMKKSVGLVAGEFVMSYPPGIPIVAPGERITPDVLEHILFAKDKGCFMTGTEDMNLDYLQVVG